MVLKRLPTRRSAFSVRHDIEHVEDDKMSGGESGGGGA